MFEQRNPSSSLRDALKSHKSPAAPAESAIHVGLSDLLPVVLLRRELCFSENGLHKEACGITRLDCNILPNPDLSGAKTQTQ